MNLVFFPPTYEFIDNDLQLSHLDVAVNAPQVLDAYVDPTLLACSHARVLTMLAWMDGWMDAWCLVVAHPSDRRRRENDWWVTDRAGGWPHVRRSERPASNNVKTVSERRPNWGQMLTAGRCPIIETASDPCAALCVPSAFGSH